MNNNNPHETPAVLRLLQKISSVQKKRKEVEGGRVVVCFDGACWPNPGGAAAGGVLIKVGSKVLLRKGFYVGQSKGMSCNVAEYKGVIRALQFLKRKGFADRKIVVRGDSQLVINQMSGKWKIKHGLYVEAATKAKSLAEKFTDLSFEWISRDENTVCDELAESALQRRAKH